MPNFRPTHKQEAEAEKFISDSDRKMSEKRLRIIENNTSESKRGGALTPQEFFKASKEFVLGQINEFGNGREVTGTIEGKPVKLRVIFKTTYGYSPSQGTTSAPNNEYGGTLDGKQLTELEALRLYEKYIAPAFLQDSENIDIKYKKAA